MDLLRLILLDSCLIKILSHNNNNNRYNKNMYNKERKIQKNFSFENEDGLSTYDIALISLNKRKNKKSNMQNSYEDLLAA